VELLEHRVTTGLESMPLMRRWRLALVVLTVDDFIHVFDLPPEEVRVGCGAWENQRVSGEVIGTVSIQYHET
jgi:hypothetical protein